MSEPETSDEDRERDGDEPRAEDLSDELARKYDPERLLSMVSRRAGRGEALEHGVRTRYERRFGVDLSHVRVYTGELAEELNRRQNAYALTIANTGMVMMGGSPDRGPGSAAGQALLAHELTHVAQATRGTMGLHRKASFDGGMPFAEEHEAEAESVEHEVMAEEMGGAALHGSTGELQGKAKLAAEQGYKRQLEQIKARVLELAGESGRVQQVRNGPPARRP